MSIALSGVTALITAAVESLTSWLVGIWDRGRRRKREQRDSALAAGRRLIELMAAQASVLTVMLAKHRPLAPASFIAEEARELGQLVAECESCAVEARSATALRDPVDRLLATALEAAEFTQGIRAWRRADMAAWADISQRWAKERVRLLDHLRELSHRRPRDVL